MHSHLSNMKIITMKKLYTTLLLIAITVLSPLYTTAQFANIEDDSGWSLGFNMGAAFQQSDSRDKAGFAGGLIIGKSIYHRPTRVFRYDLRLRFLAGNTYGNNLTPSEEINFFNLEQQQAYTLHKEDSAYHNYRTQIVSNVDLELMIMANRLRENTGIILYAFGGIGITRWRAFTNQLDRNLQRYDYSEIDINASSSQRERELRRLRDREYESRLPGSESTNTSFMPSVGLGLGYQLGRSFSIGVEHRLTFTLTDDFNGISANSDNDLYHYTALKFSWRILRGGGSGGSSGGGQQTDSTRPVDNYSTRPTGDGTETTTGGGSTQPEQVQKPKVKINSPQSPHETQEETVKINASIDNINDGSQITFTENGNSSNNFSFNSNSGTFTSTVAPNPGSNMYQITATNSAGSDQASAIIQYTVEEEDILPEITYNTPASSPRSVEEEQKNVNVTVLNVEGKDNIQFRVNGKDNPFNYNTSNKRLTASISLNEGANVIETTASNNAGTVSQSATIVYDKKETINPPVISITQPQSATSYAQVPSAIVQANIFYVSSKSDVYLKINGSYTRQFDYNPSTNSFSVSIHSLNQGPNYVEITATNSSGTASASRTIIYRVTESLPKPIISLVNPHHTPYQVSTSNFNLRLRIENVSSKNDISMKFNGATSHQFTFNASTGLLNKQVILNEGTNMFEATATNAAGSDSKVIIIIYQPESEPAPPKITVENPKPNSVNVSKSTFPFKANIENIGTHDDLTFKLNGIELHNYNFNPSSGNFTANLNLVTGSNLVEIKAANSDGETQKVRVIVYSPQTPPDPKPIITVEKPGNNPHTTNSSPYGIEATIQHIQDASNITYSLNGQQQSSFNYNPNTKKFTTNANLNPGTNMYQIIAENNAGTAVASGSIIFEEPVSERKPRVIFDNPSNSPHTTQDQNISVIGRVLGVDSKNQIAMKINGVNTTNFTFNPNSKQFTVNRSFSNNVTTMNIEVTGTNTAGSDTQTMRINYEKPVDPPVITIQQPTQNPYATAPGDKTVLGQVSNISSKSDMTVRINGNVTSNFAYQAANSRFSIPVTLGTNTMNIQITATNSGGQDVANVILDPIEEDLDEEEESVPGVPSISMINPSSSPYNSTRKSITVTAKVIRVFTNNNFQIKVNGQSTSNFSYNLSNEQLSIPVTLKNGSNTISIVAMNTHGSRSETIVINYQGKDSDNDDDGGGVITRPQAPQTPDRRPRGGDNNDSEEESPNIKSRPDVQDRPNIRNNRNTRSPNTNRNNNQNTRQNDNDNNSNDSTPNRNRRTRSPR